MKYLFLVALLVSILACSVCFESFHNNTLAREHLASKKHRHHKHFIDRNQTQFAFSSNDTDISYKYNTCIITRVRDVDYLMEEWFKFHVRIGVGHFFMADDCSTDNGSTVSIIEKYEKLGVATLYRRNPHLDCDNHLPNTSKHLNYLFHLQKDNCKWMTSIDPDEYLFPTADTSDIRYLDKVLAASEASLPVIRIAGYIMSNRGDVNRTTQPLLHRYRFGSMQAFIKTIALSRVVENWYSAHYPQIYDFTWNDVPVLQNVTNIFFEANERWYFTPPTCPRPVYPINLRHYKSMSLQDHWLRKLRKYEAHGLENRYRKNMSSTVTWDRERNSQCVLPGTDLFLPNMLISYYDTTSIEMLNSSNAFSQ